MNTRVQILGAGVIGLSTAIAFLEAGHPVTITAGAFTPHTTSDKAAAIWLPFKAEPRDKVLRWSGVSYARFNKLARDKASGVHFVDLNILEPRPEGGLPWWASILPENAIKKIEKEQLPEGYRYGLSAYVPFIDVSIYMEYLQNHVLKLGGSIIKKEVNSLSEWIDATQININCTGLGAKQLMDDPELFPIQGQIVKIGPIEDLPFITDEESNHALAYIFSRSDGVILGGTATYNEGSLLPQADTTKDILQRCAYLSPKIIDPLVLDSYIGLRPGRKTVRLEVVPSERLIHNYGHGGSGFTISWGCAFDVLELARELQ